MFMDRKTQYFQMSVLPKLTYRFSTIPIKIPASYFFVDSHKSSVYMERQKTQNSQYNMEREEPRRTDVAQLQTDYKATVVRRVSHWWENKQRSMEQNQSPETDPCKYSLLILDKEARQYNGAKTVFLTNRLEPTDIHTENHESRHKY